MITRIRCRKCGEVVTQNDLNQQMLGAGLPGGPWVLSLTHWAAFFVLLHNHRYVPVHRLMDYLWITSGSPCGSSA